MQTDLVAIVRKAQAGEAEAFTDLYHATSNRVYWLSRKMMRNEQDAEDAAQQVYVKIFEKIKSLRDPQAAISWIDQITRNVCLSEIRRQNRREGREDERIDDVPDTAEWMAEENKSYLPEGYMDDQESRKIIMEIIDSLPEAQAQTVYLYYYSEMSVQQIAEAMEVSEGTVKSRLSAARAKIKAAVEDQQRQGIKLFAFPALGLLLRQDAEACAPPPALDQAVAQQIGQLLSQAAPMAAGAAGALKHLSLGAKILIAGLGGAAVVIGSVVLSNHTSPPPVGLPEPPAVTEPAPSQPAAPEPAPSGPETPQPDPEPSQLTPERMLGMTIGELKQAYGEPAGGVVTSDVWDNYSWETPQFTAMTAPGGETVVNVRVQEGLILNGVTPGDSEAAMQSAWSGLTPETEPFTTPLGVTVYGFTNGELTYQADVKDGVVVAVYVYPAGSLG